jgi:hypothetical protein
MKIVKGQGLCKLVVETTSNELHEDSLYHDQELYAREVCYIPLNFYQW